MQIYPNTYEHFLTEVITALDLNVLTFSILEVSVSAKKNKSSLEKVQFNLLKKLQTLTSTVKEMQAIIMILINNNEHLYSAFPKWFAHSMSQIRETTNRSILNKTMF